MKTAEEFYEKYNALHHTDDGTTNKYDITADKSAIIQLMKEYATQQQPAGEWNKMSPKSFLPDPAIPPKAQEQGSAKERYDKAVAHIKNHNNSGEWFVTLDAIKIAAGLNTE